MYLNLDAIEQIERAEMALKNWCSGQVPPEFGNDSRLSQLHRYVEREVNLAFSLLRVSGKRYSTDVQMKYTALLRAARRFNQEETQLSPNERWHREEDLRQYALRLMEFLHTIAETGRRYLHRCPPAERVPPTEPPAGGAMRRIAEQASSDSAKPGQSEGPQRDPQSGAPLRGSIIGMTWCDAKPIAEKIVNESGFPGKAQLARQIGCDARTLDKAIEDSEVLTAAKKEYEENKVRTPRAVSLSDKHLHVIESKAAEPSDEAAIRDVLARLSRDKMIAQIEQWTKVAQTTNDSKRVDTKQLVAEMKTRDERALAKIYLQVKQQIDEINADDPKTPGRRKQL